MVFFFCEVETVRGVRNTFIALAPYFFFFFFNFISGNKSIRIV